jgi:predicted P-loop ATPase
MRAVGYTSGPEYFYGPTGDRRLFGVRAAGRV